MNPFSRGRYEYIPTHLYYLPEGIIQKLEDSKPSYVVGSRGSGKTTLLKALNWKERTDNQWLVNELDGDSFRGRFIATYTKLPLVQINAFQYWLRDANDIQHNLLFGAYLDLIATENLAYSIAELLCTSHFEVTIKGEKDAIDRFLKECDYLTREPAPTSLKECHSLIRLRRRELESQAIAEMPLSECIATAAVPAAGEIIRSFGKHMAKMLDDSSDNKRAQWHFKCCFDEAECLNKQQLVVLNTLIRTSEWPISYVVSFVGQPNDLSLTSYENLTTQSADLSVILIDELSWNEFQCLCDGVANIRVQAALSDLQSENGMVFTTSKTLGDLNMNELIGDMIKGSEGKFAKSLVVETAAFKKSAWNKSFVNQESEPYLQAYLANRLELEPPSSLPTAKREQASREFRKKFVASFLSICREMDRRKIPYAYSNMVFGISDKCVRDYLSQMHHIFAHAKMMLHDFVVGTVDWKIQNEAIHKASEEKRDSIKSGEELSNPERVRRLTIALGELTAILQKGDAKKINHLQSSERGVFNIGEAISPSGSKSDLYRILKDASDAGFLRLKQDGKKILTFKVHASMAPAFGFSYRGAYYDVRIKKQDIIDILDSTNNEELVSIAKSIASRLAGGVQNPNQLTLFDAEFKGDVEEIDNDY